MGFRYWVNNQWRFRNKITGFDSSARYFEIGHVEVMNIKGFRLQLDNELLKQNQLPYMSSQKKEKCRLDKI
jgi:hypothetical protein